MWLSFKGRLGWGGRLRGEARWPQALVNESKGARFINVCGTRFCWAIETAAPFGRAPNGLVVGWLEVHTITEPCKRR